MAWTKMILALGLAALVGWTVASAAEEKPPAAAPAAAKPEPLTPEQLREALAGFKGFLAGEVVARRDTGLVLFVRSITLVEGNRAQNPGLLLSREAPVEYATEKDEKGDVQPRKSLVSLMERIEKLPAIAFGVPGGGNIMIMMGDGGDAVGGAVVAEGHAEVHAGRIIRGGALRLEMNGQRIQIGGEPDDAKDALLKEKVHAFEARFEAENGALSCYDLLGGYDMSKPEDAAVISAKGLTNSCPAKCVSACAILDDMLKDVL